MTNRTGDIVAPAGALAAGVVVWWTVTVLFAIPAFVLPSPTSVAAQLVDTPRLYLRHAGYTLEKILYGGGVGIAVGFLLAVAVATLPWFRRAVYPYLVTVRVLPKVAIAPLLLIYLGTGMATAIVFIAIIAFFPLVLSTVAGLDRMPAEQRDLLQSVDAHPVQAFLRVRFPYALPDIFAGLKQSITVAVVGAVVAEWIVADNGLGFLILIASENLRTGMVLAALTVLLVEGLLLYGGIVVLQRRMHWAIPE